MMETRSRVAHDDRTPLAIAAGLAAGLLSGGAWAAIVLLTGYEIGWAAWGIGAVVGIAMGWATQNRSRGLALTAAGLAIVGLVAGKAFVMAGSTDAMADHLMENPEYLEAAVAWHLYGEGALAPETMDAIAATDAAGDTLSDALWADMLSQAGDRLAVMAEVDRRALAEETARGFITQMGLLGGVAIQLGPFDLLWLFLAVATAFRLMDGRPEEQLAVATEQEAEEPIAVP
jgi:hypothetical protein